MSSVFRDRSKLSPRYFPDQLPHRENEIAGIVNVYSRSATDPDHFPLTILQVIGPAGIGKTSSVLRATTRLQELYQRNRQKLSVAYVNLKLQGGNKYAIYRSLLDRVAPELPAQGLSAEDMLRYLLRYLRENNRYALIVLDEIDYLIKISKETSIIYDLTRLNEFEPDKPCNVKGVVFIARSTEFHSRLDAAELSTLGRIPVAFEPYSIEQIADILESRSSEAFAPKALGSDVIDQVSVITASPDVRSDIRFALDLLLYAGNLAESSGSSRVTLEHIRTVHGQMSPSVTSEDIEQLSKNHIVALLALVRALKSRKKAFVELKDVRAFASEVADQIGTKRIDVEDYLDDLKSRRMIDLRSFREIGLHGASLSEVESLLLKRLETDKNGG